MPLTTARVSHQRAQGITRNNYISRKTIPAVPADCCKMQKGEDSERNVNPGLGRRPLIKPPFRWLCHEAGWGAGQASTGISPEEQALPAPTSSHTLTSGWERPSQRGRRL